MNTIVNPLKLIGNLDIKGFANMAITGPIAVYNGQHFTYYVCFPRSKLERVLRCYCFIQEAALKSNALVMTMHVAQILADSTINSKQHDRLIVSHRRTPSISRIAFVIMGWVRRVVVC